MDSVAHRRDLVAAATERMRRLFAHHTMVCLCSMQTIFNIEIYNSLLSTKITLQVETFWIIKKEKNIFLYRVLVDLPEVFLTIIYLCN